MREKAGQAKSENFRISLYRSWAASEHIECVYDNIEKNDLKKHNANDTILQMSKGREAMQKIIFVSHCILNKAAKVEPEVLVLDEPTAGLDPCSKRQLFSLLKEMQGSGTTIILVSHSMEEISEYADRVVVFLDGTVCMDGSPESVFSQKELLDRAGLEMPQIMETLWKVRQRGVPVVRLVCDEERAEDEILRTVTDRRGGTNAQRYHNRQIL